jgi:hypothetical protein
LIFHNQVKPEHIELTHDAIRSAVRAWAADCRSQEFVAALIADEWRRTGNDELVIPTEPQRQMQKSFVGLMLIQDMHKPCALTPAILAVLPLEYRSRLVPQEDMMSRIAAAMKECSEAKAGGAARRARTSKIEGGKRGIASLFQAYAGAGRAADVDGYFDAGGNVKTTEWAEDRTARTVPAFGCKNGDESARSL